MTGARGLPLGLMVAAVTVAADRVTKIWAENALVAGSCRPGDGCIELVGSLRLHLVYNRGAAFSTGTRLGPLFGVVAAVMAVVLLRLAARAPDRIRTVLFALIAGGAVGNLIDRIVRAEDGPLSGGVVDFVDLQWWPVFNVADAAVVIGVLAFAAHSLLGPDRPLRTVPDPHLDPDPGTTSSPTADPEVDPEPGDRGGDGDDGPAAASGAARERVAEAGG